MVQITLAATDEGVLATTSSSSASTSGEASHRIENTAHRIGGTKFCFTIAFCLCVAMVHTSDRAVVRTVAATTLLDATSKANWIICLAKWGVIMVTSRIVSSFNISRESTTLSLS